MVSITELIKILRERTGAGMLDCKKALEANNNDLEKASDWLREKGITKAAKKADRIAAEGLTTVLVKGNKALVLEVNSETDFVAKNEKFVELVSNVAEIIIASNAKTLDEALALPTSEGTLKDTVVNATARIGEKLSVRRFEILTKKDNQQFGSYIHMGGKISVLAVLENASEEVAKDVAMHVCASNPTYVTKTDIGADFIEKEKHIQLEAAKNDPELSKKPEAALVKIVEGRVAKTLKELCLVDQPFVKQPDITVGSYLDNNHSKVVSFVRYMVGEGMQKREDDFANEVMKQVK